MDYNKTNLTKPETWNRTIIKSYWIISLIVFIGQLIILFLGEWYFSQFPIKYYVVRFMVIPDVLLSIILFLTEIGNRFMKKYTEHLVIFSGMLISYTILFAIDPSISGGQIVLILPIIVSIFYFSKKITLLTSGASLVVFSSLYILSSYQRQYINIFSFSLIILMIIGVTVAGIGILARGNELFINIEKLIISEEKLVIENAIMDKLSKTDALTGLYNHRTFHEYIDAAIEHCTLYSLPLQLAIIDIDNFKKVNDTFGHKTGDLVLKEVAEKIKNHVTPNDFVARYGGEEFAIIFTEKTISESYSIVEDIRLDVAKTKFEELNNGSVSISIGMDAYVKGKEKNSLFVQADSHLYTAKRTGKNKTVFQ